MIERIYGPAGGVVSERRTGSNAPNDFPAPGAYKPGASFKDQWYGAWNPSDFPDDPHDEEYEIVHGPAPIGGRLPGNISDHGGGVPGPFSSAKPIFAQPGPASDPHDVGTEA